MYTIQIQAFDFEYNRCKDLIPKLTKEEKKVAEGLMDESPLAKEFNKYTDINPEEVR